MTISQLAPTQRKVLEEILHQWLEGEMTGAAALELMIDLNISKPQLKAYLAEVARRTNSRAEDSASEGYERDADEYKAESRRIALFVRTLR